MGFLHIRLLDIIDISLFAFLLYQAYKLIKGSAAINIFFGLFATYLIWLLVKALDMQLLGSILGQVMGVGVLALIIVFQQEIRKFLLMVGSRYFSNKNLSIETMFAGIIKEPEVSFDFMVFISACQSFSATKTGALIVIEKDDDLSIIARTGDEINGNISEVLMASIFFKNSPLHDGAVIISNNRVKSARCILPVSDSEDLAANYGLRHRSALGISEETDAFVLIVSEETGNISICRGGLIESITSIKLLNIHLQNHFKSS